VGGGRERAPRAPSIMASAEGSRKGLLGYVCMCKSGGRAPLPGAVGRWCSGLKKPDFLKRTGSGPSPPGVSASASSGELVDRTKMVFGVPLPLAVRISRLTPDVDVPAIVQQSVTYLNAHGACAARARAARRRADVGTAPTHARRGGQGWTSKACTACRAARARCRTCAPCTMRVRPARAPWACGGGGAHPTYRAGRRPGGGESRPQQRRRPAQALLSRAARGLAHARPCRRVCRGRGYVRACRTCGRAAMRSVLSLPLSLRAGLWWRPQTWRTRTTGSPTWRSCSPGCPCATMPCCTGWCTTWPWVRQAHAHVSAHSPHGGVV
jgi:hypothetical protein